MNQRRSIQGLGAFCSAALVLSTVVLVGCSSSVSGEEQLVASSSDTLNKPNRVSIWPVRTIPVCFTPEAFNNAAIAPWRASVPTWLAAGISSVANVTFTGFGVCSATPTNTIAILANGTVESTAMTGWQGTNLATYIYINLVNANPNADGKGVMIHEVMHTLGFSHEFQRSDNSVTQDCTWKPEEEDPGLNYGTPIDHWSIMNSGYCTPRFDSQVLSPWDMVGLRAAYGKRSDLHGFMIKSDTNSGLAVNAWNGAAEGTVLKLSNGCTATNTNCTFTYIEGMLLSDTDPTLAVNASGGAREGATLVLTRQCTRSNPDCTWTYSKGEFLSDTNPALAINAAGGAVNGATLKTTSACTASNTDCTWTLPSINIPIGRDPTLFVTAWGGATNQSSVKLSQICSTNNNDCLWTLKKGMILNDGNSSLAVNAFNGAAEGTELKLNSLCNASNPDCTWTWKKGELLSDKNTLLPVNALNGAVQGASLVLNGGCSASNPDCLFWSWRAK